MLTITSQTVTMTRYLLELSEDQAREILIDPAPFQAQLRQALGDDVARNGHSKHKSISISRKTRKTKAQAAKAKPAGQGMTCSICKAPTLFLTQHALNIHIARAHPGHKPAAGEPKAEG